VSDRYLSYNILAEQHTPSWNEQTRRVIDGRLALRRDPPFFSEAEWLTLEAVRRRIMPQPKTWPPVPIAAMVDAKLFEDCGDGYRDHRLPAAREAWQRGLATIGPASTPSLRGSFRRTRRRRARCPVSRDAGRSAFDPA
jgi:hypothetical protein